MTFSKAQQEFQIRYYLWAASEWEKEISESLPNLRCFKSGSIWKTFHFMQLLTKSDQLILARGLLKRFHPDAVKALGETCSPEEEILRRRRDEFFGVRQKYQFFQQLKKEDQLDIAEFWLQQLRAEAANVPGIAFFDDDECLLSQLDAIFRPLGSTFEEEIAVRRQAGEKIRFAGKRKLQKAITEKFQAAFGDQCIKHCRHFFEIAPKLLKGLEFENITAN